MKQKIIYFSDNFFSAGQTEIFNEEKERIGLLDLKSAFAASVDVLDENNQVTLRGKFPFFGMSWHILDASEQEIGKLKGKFSLFTKKFEYQAYDRGSYTIESEALSKEYIILSERSEAVAEFKRISGFFSSPAFQLINHSEVLTTEELIAVVMGVNAIQKRRQNAATSAT